MNELFELVSHFEVMEDKERRKAMSEKLEITKEAVLKAAESCPTAKDVLKTLFPDVFKKDTIILKPGDIYHYCALGRYDMFYLIIYHWDRRVGLCDLAKGFIYPNSEEQIKHEIEVDNYRYIGNLQDLEIPIKKLLEISKQMNITQKDV